MFYTAVTHRPVHVSTSLLWPFSSSLQQTAREDTTACIYLGSNTELGGQTMGFLMWLWPSQPQVWLSTPYEPHCKSDSLYNLHYAAGFGASTRTQGVIQAGLSSSVESRGFWLGSSISLIVKDTLHFPAPLFLGSLPTVLPLSSHGTGPLSTCDIYSSAHSSGTPLHSHRPLPDHNFLASHEPLPVCLISPPSQCPTFS